MEWRGNKQIKIKLIPAYVWTQKRAKSKHQTNKRNPIHPNPHQKHTKKTTNNNFKKSYTHTNQTFVPNKQTRRDQNRKRKVRPLPSSKCLLIDYLSSLPDCVTSEERIQLYCGFPTDDDIMTSMLKGILRWPDPAGSD